MSARGEMELQETPMVPVHPPDYDFVEADGADTPNHNNGKVQYQAGASLKNPGKP